MRRGEKRTGVTCGERGLAVSESGEGVSIGQTVQHKPTEELQPQPLKSEQDQPQENQKRGKKWNSEGK